MTKIRKSLVLSIAIMLFTVVGLNAASAASSDQIEQTLEQKIFKKILTMTYYGVFDNIGFEIDGDTVILTGKVYTALNRKHAEKRVSKIEGVSNVINNIEILPPSRFDDRIRRSTLRSFANTGGLYRYLIGPTPSVRIIVDRGHLTLEGFVSSKGDIRLANILAQGVPGVFTVTNNLKLADNMKY